VVTVILSVMETVSDQICLTARRAQTMLIWMHLDIACATLATTETIVTYRILSLQHTHAMDIVVEDVLAHTHLTVMLV
jgi:hypothetical protein